MLTKHQLKYNQILVILLQRLNYFNILASTHDAQGPSVPQARQVGSRTSEVCHPGLPVHLHAQWIHATGPDPTEGAGLHVLVRYHGQLLHGTVRPEDVATVTVYHLLSGRGAEVGKRGLSRE